jgi:hypothetical protein
MKDANDSLIALCQYVMISRIYFLSEHVIPQLGFAMFISRHVFLHLGFTSGIYRAAYELVNDLGPSVSSVPCVTSFLVCPCVRSHAKCTCR